jgi:hypothetical protein
MSGSEKLLREISDKLDLLMRLVAADVVRSASAEQDKIEMLSSSGFRPMEIAKFLNKTPDNINVQLTLIRKKKASKAKTFEQTQDSKSKQETKNTVNLSEKGR